MAIVTTEYNYKRKSHRVDIPLLVEVDGTRYSAKDWSVSGVGIEDFNLPDDQKQFDAKVILPMQGAAVTISVKLEFRNQSNNIYGFEFVELEPKQKRLLRHYIEMAVEGRIGEVEDIVSVAYSPSIDSPISEALNLTELEQGSLTRQFRIKSRLVLVIAFLFIVSIAALLFYNTTYRVRGVGVITGNTISVNAPVSGTVSNVFVNEGELVEGDSPLFVLTNEKLKLDIAALEAKEAELRGRLAKLDSWLNESDSSAMDELNRDAYAALKRAVDVASAIADERLATFESAKELYDNRLISKKDLDYRENQYRQAELVKQREIGQLQRFESQTQNKDDLLNQQRLSVLQQLGIVEQQLPLLREQPASIIVRAGIPGVVYGINIKPGTMLDKGEIAGLVELNNKPKVGVAINENDILKLKLGDEAEVYSLYHDKVFKANIVAFGRQALDSQRSIIEEITSDKHVVVLQFADPDVRLAPNERVDVWIKTFNWFE